MRTTVRRFAFAALFALPPAAPAAAQGEVVHAWQRLGGEIRERLDAPVLREPCRPARWDAEPVVLSALPEGSAPSQEPLPGSPSRVRVQRVEHDGLHAIEGLEDVRLPSGPFPSIHRLGSSTLFATSAHLVWVEAQRTRQLAAPWSPSSRSPQLLGDLTHCLALAPDGRLWQLDPNDEPRALLPPGALPARFAAFAAPSRVVWIDELGWLCALDLDAPAAQRLVFQRALPIDVESIRALTAAQADAVIATEAGDLLWYREAELHRDGARLDWPKVDVAAIDARLDGTLQIVDRCGWISTVDLRAAQNEGAASGASTQWIDGFVPGWPRTLRAVSFGGGWLLQREDALIAVRGGSSVELGSGAMPYGLSRRDAGARELPWNAIPEWILPRTIRGVSAGRAGLWILTSSSIDLFAPQTERILERHTLSTTARGSAWKDEPLAGFAGGLVFEEAGRGERAEVDFFLRAPADRELVHLRLSANGSSEIARLAPGVDVPPPPYGGVAIDANGDLLIATRRGLWWKARAAPRFARVAAAGLAPLARCDAAIPATDGGFVVLSDRRAIAWRSGLPAVERWAPEQELLALASSAGGGMSATDGHRLYDLSARGAAAWPCPATPRDAVVRTFARAAAGRGPFFVLDRENRVWRSEGSRWHALDVREPLSDASHFTAANGGGLYLHLDASLWRLDEEGGPRRVLEYRVALARWIDQRGLPNVNFAFGALLLAALVFAALGGFLLPKGPIPIARPPTLPWRSVDAVFVLAIFLLGQVALDVALRALDLEAYPVLRAALRFSVPGSCAVLALLALLHRRYHRGLEAIGVPHVRTSVAVQQVLVGVLMVVPVAIIAAGLSGWLARIGAPSEVLVQEVRPLIPIGDLERLFVFLCMAVIAPLVEELIFRGFVQNIFVQRLGPAWGILGTAVLFALLHPAGGYAPLFVLALALGLARHATGSLHVCIGLHLAQNFVPALATAVGS